MTTQQTFTPQFNLTINQERDQQILQEQILSFPFIVQNGIQNLLSQLWHSKAIILSQVMNYRLNLPRKEERKYHSDYVKQVFHPKININKIAYDFHISKWTEHCSFEQLYEMSLTGHLIRSINCEGGKTKLNNLIQLTEPFLPYLRKLNGKNFTGTTTRTVKGCLSAIVFKRDQDSLWSIDETKVDDFIRQANEKLTMFFEKQKRNFPRFDEIRVYNNCRKIKRKRNSDSKILFHNKKYQKTKEKTIQKHNELVNLIMCQAFGQQQDQIQESKLEEQVVFQQYDTQTNKNNLLVKSNGPNDINEVLKKFQYLEQKYSNNVYRCKEEEAQEFFQQQGKQNFDSYQSPLHQGLEFTTSNKINNSLQKMQIDETKSITPQLLGMLIAFDWMKDILCDSKQCIKSWD